MRLALLFLLGSASFVAIGCVPASEVRSYNTKVAIRRLGQVLREYEEGGYAISVTQLEGTVSKWKLRKEFRSVAAVYRVDQQKRICRVNSREVTCSLLASDHDLAPLITWGSTSPQYATQPTTGPRSGPAGENLSLASGPAR